MTNIRLDTTQPADWIAAFRAQADSDGQTLSEWVGDCCRANLPRSVQRELSERPGAHRPKKLDDEQAVKPPRVTRNRSTLP